MIVAICSIYDNVNLVPHFIRHYLTRLGVDEIRFSVRDSKLKMVVGMYCNARVKMVHTPSKFFADSDKAEVEDKMLADLKPDDWVMHLDLDEFQEYPAPLPEIIAEMEKHGDWALRGWIVDRVALGGKLDPLHPHGEIFEQFPIMCSITEMLLHAWTQKIMLCRRRVKLKGGVRHETVNAKFDRVPIGQTNQYLVHHFKWTSDLESRVKYRLQTGQMSEGYRRECQTLLNHLTKHKKFDLPSFDPKALDGRMVTIVPTRGRPENLDRLIRGCRRTIMSSDLLVALDDDDPALPQYMLTLERHKLPWLKHMIGRRERLGPTLNREAIRLAHRGYSVVGFMGDDHLPKTQRWDSLIFRTMPGITYGNDLLQGERLPTAAWLSSKIIATLGFMVPHGLIHLYLDNFWKDFGNKIGMLRYLPAVIIEHLHPSAHKAGWDARYAEVNSHQMYSLDRTTYEQYASIKMKDDAAKVLESFAAESNQPAKLSTK